MHSVPGGCSEDHSVESEECCSLGIESNAAASLVPKDASQTRCTEPGISEPHTGETAGAANKARDTADHDGGKPQTYDDKAELAVAPSAWQDAEDDTMSSSSFSDESSSILSSEPSSPTSFDTFSYSPADALARAAMRPDDRAAARGSSDSIALEVDDIRHDPMLVTGFPVKCSMQPSEEQLASAFRSVDDLCVHVDCSEEDGFVIEWWGLSEEERHGLGFSGRFD